MAPEVRHDSEVLKDAAIGDGFQANRLSVSIDRAIHASDTKAPTRGRRFAFTGLSQALGEATSSPVPQRP